MALERFREIMREFPDWLFLDEDGRDLVEDHDELLHKLALRKFSSLSDLDEIQELIQKLIDHNQPISPKNDRDCRVGGDGDLC